MAPTGPARKKTAKFKTYWQGLESTTEDIKWFVSPKNWMVLSNIVYFHPYLGKISILTTNIFQMGWNRQTSKFWWVKSFLQVHGDQCRKGFLPHPFLDERESAKCVMRNAPWVLNGLYFFNKDTDSETLWCVFLRWKVWYNLTGARCYLHCMLLIVDKIQYQVNSKIDCQIYLLFFSALHPRLFRISYCRWLKSCTSW